MYCSGFLTRESIPRTNFVLGSKESPHEDRFPGRSQLFLGGPSLVEGQRYSLLRQIADPNREDSSPEQRKKLDRLGALYTEVGWVTVHRVEKGAAIASFDFSCETTTPGDIVVPYKEKPTLAFRSTDVALHSFLHDAKAAKGHILGSKDFVGLLGTGQIVYTDFGSAKGAKPGDYLVISRGYASADLNEVDRLSEQLPKGTDSSAVNPKQLNADANGSMPHRVLGEVLILSLSPESSTAMITRAMSEIELGDGVESEDGLASKNTGQGTGNASSDCRPASRLRRLLPHSHACESAKAGS
jgi:hypothetical protein